MAGKKLLIIDDDADLLRALSVRLRASGYQVSQAGDGTQAISAARRDVPDLILLDIGLPGGDGYVVLERLRGLNTLSSIPVIVLSAKDPAVHRPRVLKAGAISFHEKTEDSAVLLADIRRLLGEDAA